MRVQDNRRELLKVHIHSRFVYHCVILWVCESHAEGGRYNFVEDKDEIRLRSWYLLT